MRRAEGFDLQQPDTPFPGITLDGLKHRAPDPTTVMSTFNHHQVHLRDVREMASHEGHPDNHSPGVTDRPGFQLSGIHDICGIRVFASEPFRDTGQQPGNVTGNGNITPRTPLIGHAPPPGWTEHQPRERVATRRSIRRITRDTSFRRLIRLIAKIFRRRLVPEVGAIRDGTDNSHDNRVEAR